MHDWGDKDFDWKGLGQAENIMYKWGVTVGRNGGQMKEKYGTIRWYCSPSAPQKLHDIVYNGYHYYQWGADTHPIMSTIDDMSQSYFRFIGPILYIWKKFFYGYAYHRALKAQPKLYKEILCDCECEELLFKKDRKLYESMWKKTGPNSREMI